jgi:catechol 2,3-dioxygenase-like lactoylglutathione lyase family enzyme
MSRLQQIHLPPQIASATPSGRLRNARTSPAFIFEELGQEVYPRPYPRPALCAKDWAGNDVFLWEGRRWYLSHNEEPYRYLCVPEKKLEWCWPIPPNASAVPCKSPDTGEDDHLKNCGVATEEGTVNKQGAVGWLKSVYCRDPDGSLIEISAYED